MSRGFADRNMYVAGDASAHVGVLNCERLAERRHIHHWQVDEHFHEGLHQLFVFRTGGIAAPIAGRPARLGEGAVLWMPALWSHGFDYPPESTGWVLTIPTSDMTRLVETREWLRHWLRRPRLIRGEEAPETLDRSIGLVTRIEEENRRHLEDRNLALESLFLLLLVAMRRGDAGAPRRQRGRRRAAPDTRPAVPLGARRTLRGADYGGGLRRSAHRHADPPVAQPQGDDGPDGRAADPREAGA